MNGWARHIPVVRGLFGAGKGTSGTIVCQIIRTTMCQIISKTTVLDRLARLVTAVFSDDYAGAGEEIRLASCVALGLVQQ